MIVYIESNFVLEMALEQKESSAARSILSLAESRQVELVYPSFVLSEPFENVVKARRERNILQRSLVKTLNDLKRLEPHKRIMLDLESTINMLGDAHVKQIDLLYTIFGQLAYIGRCIHIDEANFRDASIYRDSLGLSLQDSIIYSAMIADLKKQPGEEAKCFLSRDRKVFGSDTDRSIKVELEKHNCRYIGSFTQALDFIHSSLKIG